MFGTTHQGYQNGVSAYSQVGVETGVASADPHKLILMLFDGAILAVSMAKQHLAKHEVAAKGEAVSRAIDIIANGLKASLNVDVGGELAQRLVALYDYMCDRLLYANMQNNTKALDEVHDLLAEIKGAWEEIGTREKQREVA